MDLQEKKTYGYKERNEEKRAQFARVIATKHRDNLVYIDESGIYNTEDYPYGYCRKGERFHSLKLGKKTLTLPRKSGEKVWNVFHKENDESKCSGMQ